MNIYKRNLFTLTILLGLNCLSTNPIINSNSIKNLFIPINIKNIWFRSDFNPMKTSLLKRVPLGEDLGVITDNFILNINDAISPYNPAAILENNKIKVVFREDVKIKNSKFPFKTSIKSVYLDNEFNQISDSNPVFADSKTAEDPRFIDYKGKNYLIYNDLRIPGKSADRVIYMTSGDKNSRIKLDLGLNNQEKNWSPFIFNEELHFIYKVAPHAIIKLSNNESKELQILEGDMTFKCPKFWKWGEPRGGTPAIKIGDEYITFFHSSFKHKQKIIYVMGAYTFEDKPPFAIKKFSRFPIICKDCYSTPIKNTADKNKRVIFPTGLIVSENKAIVFCGENDCAIRVLEIDLKALSLMMKDIVNVNR